MKQNHIENIKNIIKEKYSIKKMNTKNSCGRINSQVQILINKDTEYNSTLAIGYIKHKEKRSQKHVFNVLEKQNIIIDAAVKQFVGKERLIQQPQFERLEPISGGIIVKKKEDKEILQYNIEEYY